MSNKLQKWERDFRIGILTEIKNAGILFTIDNIERIIHETSFKVRTRKSSTFDNCPYIVQGNPCHPEVKDLNCFLCSCPNYESFIEDGNCKINSKKGKYFFHSSLPLGKVWDCSLCVINHTPKEVKQYIIKNYKILKKEYDSI